MKLSVETPALLFSATSLILLAYTNRFLTLATIIRGLKKDYLTDPTNKRILEQIKNLNLRLKLIRNMQLLGVLSLFVSVLSMLLLFLDFSVGGIFAFTVSLLFLLSSLAVSLWEINISIKALEIHLSDLGEEVETKR